jgi:hypothetical protein
VLRVSGGTSILKEIPNEDITVDIEESIRLNVCAMAVQVFIGGEHERDCPVPNCHSPQIFTFPLSTKYFVYDAGRGRKGVE